MPPPRRLVWSFVALWWTTGALLLYWSARTTRGALATSGDHSTHVALLGAAEALSAGLFLIPRTLRLGAIGLLATFAVAFLAHALQHEFRGDLLLFAAVVTFVAVHGAVPLAGRPRPS